MKNAHPPGALTEVAMSFTPLPDPAHAGWEALLLEVGRWMRERLATLRIRSAQRATRWALAGLDDPALKDLGVDRSEIASISHDASGERRRGFEMPPALRV